MRTFLPLLALTVIALPLPALGQRVLPEIERTMWCGQAFIFAAEQIEMGGGSAEPLARDGALLVSRAQLEMLQTGHGDARVEAFGETMKARATEQLSPGGADPDISFEDCQALLETPQ